MDSKDANLEERLKFLLVQLISETGILERIVHKSKNQHRRSPYFQALLKVRRDLRLLQSADLGQILNSFAPIIKGTNSAEHALHSKLNQKKYLHGKHTYQNRLLGVARLLSQMVEPILKAAIQISLLLAKSFFMGFSLTILACLARLRVLVQQILIHVVSVFNMVSAHSQKHTLKLSSKGSKACVQYYSTSADILTLECIWEGDKYVLRENSLCRSTKIADEQGALPSESPVKYQTLDLLGQEPGIEPKNIAGNESANDELQTRTISSSDRLDTSDIKIRGTDCEKSADADPACGPGDGEGSLGTPMTRISRSESRKRVAFVAVGVSKPSESKPGQPEKKMRLSFSRNDDHEALLDLPFSAGKNTTLF